MPLQDLSDIVNSTIDAAYVFPGQGAQTIGMGQALAEAARLCAPLIPTIMTAVNNGPGKRSWLLLPNLYPAPPFGPIPQR